jgi:hypothetical protein
VDARAAPDDVCRLIQQSPATVQAVAKACGITRQAVHQWRKVPSTRVLTVAKVLGVKPHVIRPDCYEAPN